MKNSLKDFITSSIEILVGILLGWSLCFLMVSGEITVESSLWFSTWLVTSVEKIVETSVWYWTELWKSVETSGLASVEAIVEAPVDCSTKEVNTFVEIIVEAPVDCSTKEVNTFVEIIVEVSVGCSTHEVRGSVEIMVVKMDWLFSSISSK